MKYILAGIDGTGSRSWMQQSGGSAVRRFVTDFDPQGGAKRFFHGPDNELTGSDSSSILGQVREFIYTAYHRATDIQLPWQGPADLPYAEQQRVKREIIRRLDQHALRIVLVGHSRGGHIAILAAADLQPPVHFLGLFDAVDRTMGRGSSVIRNVRTTYHALRHPDIGSRTIFENTGRTSTGAYVEDHFRTSHGGIGGAYESDPSGIGADYSCATAYEDSQRRLQLRAGVRSPIVPPVGTRAALCARESRSAETWIRDAARRAGLPFRCR